MIASKLNLAPRRILPFTYRFMMMRHTLIHKSYPSYQISKLQFRAFGGCESGGAGPHTFKTIEEKLIAAFKPVSCQVLNPNGDFNSAVIKIVSSSFDGKLPLARHRMVNDVLKDEIKLIHAVQIDAKTPA